MVADLLLLLVGLLPFAVVGFFLVRAARRTTRQQLLNTVLFFAFFGLLFLLLKINLDRWGHLFPS
jgi:hypothetical protein